MRQLGTFSDLERFCRDESVYLIIVTVPRARALLMSRSSDRPMAAEVLES